LDLARVHAMVADGDAADALNEMERQVHMLPASANADALATSAVLLLHRLTQEQQQQQQQQQPHRADQMARVRERLQRALELAAAANADAAPYAQLLARAWLVDSRVDLALACLDQHAGHDANALADLWQLLLAAMPDDGERLQAALARLADADPGNPLLPAAIDGYLAMACTHGGDSGVHARVWATNWSWPQSAWRVLQMQAAFLEHSPRSRQTTEAWDRFRQLLVCQPLVSLRADVVTEWNSTRAWWRRAYFGSPLNETMQECHRLIYGIGLVTDSPTF
jgi:hypothetical protein